MDDTKGDGAGGLGIHPGPQGADDEPGRLAPPLEETSVEAAFRVTEPERAALGSTGLAHLNVKPSQAVTTVLGSLPALSALRPELIRLPNFDAERFDRLRLYALALVHAQALHRGRARDSGSLAELAGEVTRLRNRLLADARSLASHGLLERERLRTCQRSRAYMAIASDVCLLVELFREQWPALQGRTPTSEEQLLLANRLAYELLAAVGAKRNAPAAVSQTQLVQRQAFTLLFRAYEAARRAVQYVRCEQGDASRLAPAFCVGRAGRRKKAS